jgi:hypothetical protein
MPKKLTQEEWVARARAMHGDKYGYEKVEYVNGRGKVTIACLAHGEFRQNANAHLQGAGCPSCGEISGLSKRIITYEKFLLAARNIHGDRFEYDELSYSGFSEKLNILCPEHGVFRQCAETHLKSKFACPTCKNRAISEAVKWTKEQFIAKALEVHGDRYDYSLVEYTRSDTPVIVICKDHGPFIQRPNAHIHCESGCAKCSYEVRRGKSFAKKDLPGKEEILAQYEYSSGAFYRRTTSRKVLAGKRAEYVNAKGYLMLSVGDNQYSAHRLVVVMEGLGLSAEQEIDHVNGVKTDNRIENLRVVEHRDNLINAKLYKTNKTGYAGVSEVDGSYLAYISNGKRSVTIGKFATLEEAVAARKAAEIKYGYHENHGKTPEERAEYEKE